MAKAYFSVSFHLIEFQFGQILIRVCSTSYDVYLCMKWNIRNHAFDFTLQSQFVVGNIQLTTNQSKMQSESCKQKSSRPYSKQHFSFNTTDVL